MNEVAVKRLRKLKERKLKLLREKTRRVMEKSYYEFFKQAFKVLHPGEKMVDNWHIKFLCDELQTEIERFWRGEITEKHLIINIPPRSLKSMIVTVIFPAWCWTRAAGMKFIKTSFNDSLATEHNVMCRRVIESQWYQSYWGMKVVMLPDSNEKKKFENTKLGSCRSTSTDAGITGKGSDIIIIDDPVDPSQSESDVQRKTSNEYFDQTLISRLNNPERGLFIIVMQRIHEDDLTGHVMKRMPGRWRKICLPAEESSEIQPPELRSNYKDGLFFPARFTPTVLAGFKETLGSYGYAKQYSQLAVPKEGGIFKASWFKIISKVEFAKILAGNPAPSNVTMDTAYTAKKENDPTALLSFHRINGKIYVTRVEEKWFEFPELVKHVPVFASVVRADQRSRIIIEPKASGISLAQQLRSEAKKHNLNVIFAPAPKDDKITRANSVSAFTEAEKVILVEGDWVDAFIAQLRTFPNATHDDKVDCMVIAIQWHQRQRQLW